MKKIAFWIWTALCIAGAVIAITLANKDVIKTGEDIVLTTSYREILVINKEATLEAASDDFFLLRKLTGEVIVGTPVEIPLGWTSKEYYKAGPIKTEGEWLVEKGTNITIHISTEDVVNIRILLKEGHKVWGALLFIVLAFLFWLIGILFASS